MKKNITINPLIICLVLFGMTVSCMSSFSFIPVKGNGNQVTKNFDVSDFQKTDVSGGFDVTLIQGTDEGVVLTAEENLYEYIHVEVIQGVLKIYTDEHIMSTRSMKALITFKSIDNLNVSGGGDVTAQTTIDVPELNVQISGGGNLSSKIITNELNCRISGGGDATISGKASSYRFDMSGGGDLISEMDAGAIHCNLSGGGDVALKSKEKASNVNIEISGGGNADVELSTGLMKCSVSGGGDATLIGHADELIVTINGGGDVNASAFAAVKASIQASGGSDIHINVTKELHGNISGGGDIYYAGSPEIVTIDARGGSEVHKQ